jgi:hypothetical protein
LVSKGYVQQESVDFDKVFGQVLLLDSVCVLVENVAQQKWDIQHIDVKSVFLNGDIQKKVYVAQPLGFARDNEKCSVCRLHKALYGVRQAPHTPNLMSRSRIQDSQVALWSE